VEYRNYSYDFSMPHALHVLVVDGEAPTRQLLAGMLLEAGHEVSVANGTDETDRVLATYTIDIVVSAADPPCLALLDKTRRPRPTPPVIAVNDQPIHALLLLAAIRDLAANE
jgi:DNA-binding response OmpR family regulator